MEVGDLVLLRNNKINKQSPNYIPSPCEVIERYRGEVTITKKYSVETIWNVSLFFLRSTRRMVLQNQNPSLLKTSLRPTRTTCVRLLKRFDDCELSKA